MAIKNIIFILIFFSAAAFFIYSCRNLFLYMMVAKKKDQRFDNPGKRLSRLWKIAFMQTKLLRDPKAGILHLFIFWGFILFIFAVLESIIQGFYSPFTLKFAGPVYSAITLIEDIFPLLVIASVKYALYRRFVIHVPRLEVEKRGKIDASIILLLIMFVCIFMIGQNISLIAKNNFHLSDYEIRPVAAFLSPLIFSDANTAALFYEIFWWGHISIILLFLNFLPYSKHLHVLTSIPNTWFANLDPVRNTIKSINLDDENAESFGAADIEHLSWKQILDGYSCTECGRCTDACPANKVGKSLSPRKIIDRKSVV